MSKSILALFCVSVLSAPRPLPRPEYVLTAEDLIGDWTLSYSDQIVPCCFGKNGRWWSFESREQKTGTWELVGRTIYVREKVDGGIYSRWADRVQVVRGGGRYIVSELRGTSYRYHRESKLKKGGK